jgi:endonuclease-3
MTKKQIALEAVRLLKEKYSDSLCSLEAEDPFRLLVAVRLSAQCTDARVNLVTPALFARFPGPEAFAAAQPEEVEPYIRSCGFFRSKARDIVMMARMLLETYGDFLDFHAGRITRETLIARLEAQKEDMTTTDAELVLEKAIENLKGMRP